MFKIIIINLLVVQVAFAGRMGPGVPLPGWDWERAAPARPSPWTSEVAGYYYINDVTGTDSGRTYGAPNAPRNTIPAILPPGSYVEIADTYANSSGGTTFIRAIGTTNAWVADTDGPVFFKTCPTNQGRFSNPCIGTGTNFYFDGFMFDNTTGNSFRFGSGSTLLRVQQCVLRNCLAIGDGVNDHSGFATAGLDETERANNVVMYYNGVSNITIFDSPEDLDRMAFSTSAYASNVWVFSNWWSRADGSRAGASDIGIDPEFTRNVYFVSNYVFGMRQQGMAIKYGMNCLFAWNTITNVISSASSPGKCMGGQYNPTNWWTVGNRISGARYPIFMGSGDSGVRPIYHVGNIITDARLEDENPYVSDPSSESASQFNSGYVMHYMFNTIYNCCAGLGHDSAGGNSIYVENNVFYPNYIANAHIMAFENSAGAIIRNNIIYDDSSFRILSSSTTWTSLAAMENGTTRTDNVHDNPDFNSAATYDFRLQENSPAVGLGLNTNEMTVDIFAQYTAIFGETAGAEFRAHFERSPGVFDAGAIKYSAIGPSDPIPHRAKIGNNIRLRAR
jgi:hypothetical protein